MDSREAVEVLRALQAWIQIASENKALREQVRRLTETGQRIVDLFEIWLEAEPVGSVARQAYGHCHGTAKDLLRAALAETAQEEQQPCFCARGDTEDGRREPHIHTAGGAVVGVKAARS